MDKQCTDLVRNSAALAYEYTAGSRPCILSAGCSGGIDVIAARGGHEDTEYNQVMRVSGGDGQEMLDLEMLERWISCPSHLFGVSGGEDAGGNGNAVHLGAADAAGGRPNLHLLYDDPAETGFGEVLPSPEPAELIAGKTGMSTRYVCESG